MNPYKHNNYTKKNPYRHPQFWANRSTFSDRVFIAACVFAAVMAAVFLASGHLAVAVR